MAELGYALRSLWRSPTFALAAILTIALGVGVNTAVFHLIHTVLLDPLPFRQPERLVHIAETHPDFPTFPVSTPDYVDWARIAGSFDGMAAHTFDAMNKGTLLGEGEPETVQVLQASHQLFPLLGIRPLLGRAYSADEEAKRAPVVMLSESLWRRAFRAEPGIIGRKIRVNQFTYEVVGVIAQRQAYPAWGEIWMPFSLLDPALLQTRRFHALEVVGRLKAGVSVEQAQAEMSGIATRLAQLFSDTNGTVGASVSPLAGWITGEVRPVLFVAWAAVGLVLLLACANVAHLVLVRTAHRSREMAVRAALGAGAGRMAWMLLLENLVVALAGGALGALLAWGLLPALLTRLTPGDIPRLDATSFSLETLAFGLFATLVCGILFAFPAVIHSRQLDIQEVIKSGGQLLLGRRRTRFGGAVIAVEIGLAFAVVTGAGLLYGSFAALLHEDPGFVSTDVTAVDVPLGVNWEKAAIFYESNVAPRLREIPGVTQVGAANLAPMSLGRRDGSRYSTRYGVAGRTFARGQFPVAQLRWTTPEYFETLRIPLRRGRLYRAGETGYVINEALARRMFPGRDPVGQEILMNVVTATPNAVPILGVVGDVRDMGLEVDPPPAIYTYGISNSMTVFVRGGSPEAVRGVLRAVNPEAPIRVLAPLADLVQKSLARRRMALELLGFFAGLAGLLTAIGVYGVVSYSLNQRRAEFAIRLALGAARRHMLHLILRGFAVPAIAGLTLGGWLAYLFAGVLKTQLYKLSPGDPLVFLCTAAGLCFVVLMAALRPAVRAATISPNAVPRA